jgi:hypothetical protein
LGFEVYVSKLLSLRKGVLLYADEKGSALSKLKVLNNSRIDNGDLLEGYLERRELEINKTRIHDKVKHEKRRATCPLLYFLN